MGGSRWFGGRAALVVGVVGTLSVLAGCGGGGGGSSGRLAGFGGGTSGGGASGGSTGGSQGPAVGAPQLPTVYALLTTDNAARTPMPQSVAAASVGSGALLTPLTPFVPTAGMAHQIFASCGLAVSPDRRFVFVGHNSTNAVESFRTRIDGTLEPTGSVVSAGQATSIAVHPTLPLIYVSHTIAGATPSSVDVIRYDPTSGALAPVASVPVADSLRGIAVDPAGASLVTVHMFGTGRGLALYLLDTGGNILTPALQTISIGSGRPADAKFDRTGRRVYVRDLDAGIRAYAVGATGMLQPLNGGTPYPLAPGAFFSDLVTHPTRDYLYALSAFSSKIFAYSIQSSGLLTALPAFTLNDDCQHLAISNAGDFLFATSRQTSHIRAFTIDPFNGYIVANVMSPFAITAPPDYYPGSIIVND